MLIRLQVYLRTCIFRILQKSPDYLVSIILTLDAPRLANCHTNILKLVITKFLRLVFVHSYFTAAFYIINIIQLPAVYLSNIPQFYYAYNNKHTHINTCLDSSLFDFNHGKYWNFKFKNKHMEYNKWQSWVDQIHTN